VSQPTQNTDPIDFSRVREVAEGDHGFERQVLTVFLMDATTRLRQIASAIETGDFATAVLECHNLKGASGNVGALTLRALAETCEGSARQQDAKSCRAALQDAEPELARVRKAIDAYLR
jgi:HPt (histidine-containing phosphotransfer) domain-containing protein